MVECIALTFSDRVGIATFVHLSPFINVAAFKRSIRDYDVHFGPSDVPRGAQNNDDDVSVQAFDLFEILV